jgi:hypothetical protein
MPSIFTHLLLAEDAIEALPVGPARAHLEAHRRAYFLGALAPDLPYFDVFLNYRGLPLGSVLSPVSHSLEHRVAAWLGWSLPPHSGWSKRLHGLDADKVLQAWAAFGGIRSGELLALAAGMLTHLAVDEVMHPKINADSGDERSLAGMQRHRELEINLDLQLLRLRGVGLESLSLCGLLESYLGRVDQRGEHLSPSLKQAWAEASQACDGDQALQRRQLDAWSRGFAKAMGLLEHRLSPMQQHLSRFPGLVEQRWRTYFARERYLASHVPRAQRRAQAAVERGLGAALPKEALS